MKNLESDYDGKARKSNRTISLVTSMALVLCSTSAMPASGQSAFPLQGPWDIWCERTHNDTGTTSHTSNDGFQVFGYFAIKGAQYPKTSNRCYVKNVAAPGRKLKISTIEPTGHDTNGSCNTSYVGVLNSDVKAGGTVGQDEVGSIGSFNVSIVKNAPCAKPMEWMSPGTTYGYIRLSEQGGTSEYTLPVTMIARP